MTAKSQRLKGQDTTLSSLNAAIEAMNLAEKILNTTPATVAFSIVSVLLTMIKDSMINELDYVELGLSCADVCKALGRGMDGKRLDDLSPSVRDAINQLTTAVAEIQRNIIKRSRRNIVSRLFHARNDKEMIAAWKSNLNKILHIFNTELAMNTHTIVADIRQEILRAHEDADSQNRVTQNSSCGESPPPSPRVLLGRDELIEKIVGFAERLTPIALIGAGGIGKTSTALTVLHDNRVKRRFGEDRRFIRCDEFPPSLAHFLRRLSKAIGAGIENPEDLHSLRPFLSSKDIFLVLDNAESILDPQVTDSQEIYAAVEELSRLSNICLCITSRISTFPPDCKWLDIPTLPTVAARDAFYQIYNHSERSHLINNILEQLDFHPLSITLLATVAHHNRWDATRLASEWEERRIDMLQTGHNRSLAATIELSLSSSTFQELGSNARDLLGVVAFFPQGVDENSLDRLFPAITERRDIFDKFCVLSLTYRSNGFVTMLAPLRHYLFPKDPTSAPLLRSTKEYYFNRLSTPFHPGSPGFEETRWITLEDANVEHLLDVFTTIGATSDDVWSACANFVEHLDWHKPRFSILGPRIEKLPDGHPFKPQCLSQLSKLFRAVGNYTKQKQLLTHTLRLLRERGNDHRVARILMSLSDANGQMDLYEEGLRQAEEASEIFERLGDTVQQASCLVEVARLLRYDGQLDAAEETAFRAIDLLPEEGEPFQVCKCHRVIGRIYDSKGEPEKAIHHFEVALRIASSFNLPNLLFWIHFSLAHLFFDEDRFDDAHAHVERAKSHTFNDAYLLARALQVQAGFWHKRKMFEEAKSEALRAVDVFEGLGAGSDAEAARELVQWIDLDDKKKWRIWLSRGEPEPKPKPKSVVRHVPVLTPPDDCEELRPRRRRATIKVQRLNVNVETDDNTPD